MALLRSVATVGGFTMLSRVLGFVRDILIAGFLGAGPVADAYVVAFRIPNLFRRLVAEGAFSAAFVPMFARRLEGDGQDAALSFANQAFAVMLAALFLFTLAAEAAMPWVVLALAPGFAEDPDKFALTVDFTRIAFPYLTCMALVALLGGMLTAVGRFAAMSAAPVLLNLILISALLVGGLVADAPGWWLIWGIALAGFGQLAWLLAACVRAGLRIRLVRPRLTAEIRRLLKLMLPGVIGGGVTQINLLVGTIIATLIGPGAVSYLYYADRVYQLPLGVVGVAMGTALLPLLSRQLRAGDEAAAMTSLNRGLETALLLTVPAAAALMVMPWPVVSVLFERGAFDAGAADATAAALAAFATGLPAYVLVKVLAPGFFAREDTVTPVRYAVVAMAANIGLSLALMAPLAHVGLAVATAVSAWLNAGLLAWGLRARGHFTLDARFKRRLPAILGASAIMGALLWPAAHFADPWLRGPLGLKVAALLALVVGGFIVFAVAAHLTGAARLSDLKQALGRKAA